MKLSDKARTLVVAGLSGAALYGLHRIYNSELATEARRISLAVHGRSSF